MKNLRHLDNHDCDQLSEMPTGMSQLSNLQTLPVFIVGEEEGHHITELQQLNQIRGGLAIKNLQKVRNPMEAREAKLRAKTHVKELELDWKLNLRAKTREEANVSEEEEEEVLESLVPPPNLKKLLLFSYLGISYPGWLQSSTNLVYITLSNLKKLERLPPLGQLPYLKSLELIQMPAIRRIGEEFYGEAGGGDKPDFQSLEQLDLRGMDNLEEWVVERGDIERDMMFPHLNKLKLEECPKLTRVEPGLPVSVVDLEIYGEVVLAAESLSGMKSVRRGILGASSFPWEGLHYFTALVEFKLYICKEMRCLPEGLIHLHIPTLRTLLIDWCREMTCLGMTSLVENENGAEEQQQPPQPQPQPPPLFFTSLHHLTIRFCHALTALPEWVGGLTSLQTLTIRSCPKLEMLPAWMGGLSSLQTLEIRGCPKVGMLPDGLQHLRTLQQLTIRRCPILERRCKRETGEDWHKIAHIPNIQLNPSSEP